MGHIPLIQLNKWIVYSVVSMTPWSQKFELSILISPRSRSYIQKYFSLSIRALVSLVKKIGVLESRDTVPLSNVGMLYKS